MNRIQREYMETEMKVMMMQDKEFHIGLTDQETQELKELREYKHQLNVTMGRGAKR